MFGGSPRTDGRAGAADTARALSPVCSSASLRRAARAPVRTMGTGFQSQRLCAARAAVRPAGGCETRGCFSVPSGISVSVAWFAMQLIGLTLDNHMGRVWRGYMPLDEITVVLGPNDAGKSRTVNLLCELLDRTPNWDWFYGSPVGALAVELDDDEVAGLLNATFELTPERRRIEDGQSRAGSELPLTASDAAQARVDSLLQQSNLFIFESNLTEFAGWRIWRALRGTELLSDNDRRAAEEIQGVEESDPPELAWRHVKGSPMALSCAGHVELSGRLAPVGLPAPVRVPTSWSEIATALRDEISYRIAASSTGRMFPLGDEPPRDAADIRTLWLEYRGEDARLEPLVRQLSATFREVANGVLPEFVSRRCTFDEPVPSPFVRWEPTNPIVFELLTAVATDDETPEDFPIEAAADGHQVWLQLAALQALDYIRRLPIEPYPDNGTWPAAREYRPPLYALDEPERHLHPRLHRAAARWLVDLARRRQCQVVVITHAVPFLTLGEGVRYVYISPDADVSSGSTIRAISADELTAMSEIAAELGLNRGQLLANVHVLLFVEGRADQLIIEALYGPRLRELGVAVVPLSGAGNHAQLFESDLLLRYSTARIALMLDNVTEPEIRLLQTDDKALEAALRGKRVRTEIKAMAHVIKNARQHTRHVEPFAHSRGDIFDLLDEDILVQRFRDFPGHRAAEEAFLAQRDAKVANRKKFYADSFAVSWDLADLVSIADAMSSKGITPPELDTIIDSIEFYALASGE